MGMWERLPTTQSIQRTSSDLPHINSDTKTWSPQRNIPGYIYFVQCRSNA